MPRLNTFVPRALLYFMDAQNRKIEGVRQMSRHSFEEEIANNADTKVLRRKKVRYSIDKTIYFYGDKIYYLVPRASH